ncbi:MAG TPA: TauD/TfdA family dioxygenase [Gammaproteobacteria bacterium]
MLAHPAASQDPPVPGAAARQCRAVRTSTYGSLCEFAHAQRQPLLERLRRHGAILFKGFCLDSPQKLRKFAKAVSENLLDYVDRAAPRIELTRRVYTSTEYPSDQWIPLHHEMSYSHIWPSILYFGCLARAQTDGFTPIADDRRIYPRIPECIKEEFEAKGLLYIRNYVRGADMTWQEAFQTDSREELDRLTSSEHMTHEWIGDDHLRTTLRKPATMQHPITRDTVWFNHAHLFHESNLPPALHQALLESYGPDGMPRRVVFGDGSEIDADVLEELRNIYMSEAIGFEWENGDALMLDNILTTHGRSPFVGPRKICVAMSDQQSLNEVGQ